MFSGILDTRVNDHRLFLNFRDFGGLFQTGVNPNLGSLDILYFIINFIVLFFKI